MNAFRISGGIIYGNEEINGLKRNFASSSASLFVNSSSSICQYGTFNVSNNWVSSGNLSSSNNTIRVENGVLK